jgi:glyoxylase-like metal-dependent hydrolase (beta-lactamase superfamily II)
MHRVQTYRWGPVRGFELGFGPVGRPLMTVHFYHVDGMLIDAGQRNLQSTALALVRDLPVRQILLTHHHEDHSGNAAFLRQHFKAPVLGHRLTAAKLMYGYPIRPYQHWVWGSAAPLPVAPLPTRIEGENVRLTPIHTPGHSRDHTVYHEPHRGWLFAGDLFIGARIKFFRADENIHTQIASLQRVLNLDFDALFCAHNPCPTGGKRQIARKLDFLVSLREEVRALRARGLATKAIIRRMDPRQDRLVRWVTLGNASFANMVRSVLENKIGVADTTTPKEER